MELDHIFVYVEPKAPEAEFLQNFGLTQGSSRIHQGQGTANVCFFFHNAYLELLWLNNSNKIQSPVVSPTNLWQRCRWQRTKACPFGIALRNVSEIPFSTWNYYAPYLPANAFIPILANSENLSEPLIFISPSSKKPANFPLEKQHLLTHQAGFKEITGVRVILPGDKNFSVEVSKLIELRIIECLHGDFYHLEIEFDSGQEGKLQDFQPTLPIALKW